MGCYPSSSLQPLTHDYHSPLSRVLTQQQVEAGVASVIPCLPMAQLMNDSTIKLEGTGLFNPNSLLDPSWLKGKMTVDEYSEAINYINKCASHAQIGLSTVCTESELPMRKKLKSEVGMAVVQQLNERFRSVRFTIQETTEMMQIDMSRNENYAMAFARMGKPPPVISAPLTVLYIIVNWPILFLVHELKYFERKRFYAKYGSYVTGRGVFVDEVDSTICLSTKMSFDQRHGIRLVLPGLCRLAYRQLLIERKFCNEENKVVAYVKKNIIKNK